MGKSGKGNQCTPAGGWPPPQKPPALPNYFCSFPSTFSIVQVNEIPLTVKGLQGLHKGQTHPRGSARPHRHICEGTGCKQALLQTIFIIGVARASKQTIHRDEVSTAPHDKFRTARPLVALVYRLWPPMVTVAVTLGETQTRHPLGDQLRKVSTHNPAGLVQGNWSLAGGLPRDVHVQWSTASWVLNCLGCNSFSIHIIAQDESTGSSGPHRGVSKRDACDRAPQG